MNKSQHELTLRFDDYDTVRLVYNVNSP